MLHSFKDGDRVRTAREIDRFPDFMVAAGATGTVCMVERDSAIAVKMDDLIAGCEEWNNEVHWFEDYRDDVAGDLAIA